MTQPVLAGPSIGWDLGGVHVRAALVVAGRVRSVVQAPCSLWRGVGALDESWAALPGWCRTPAHHVVTMTGELTDCFSDRASGVQALSEWAAARLPGDVRIYAGRSGLIAPDAAPAAALDVASANWHATAGLVGRSEPEALLVDIGSTTADLIPIVGGRPASLAYTDAERLETGELVYTGVVRTPVLALARRAPFRGRWVALMAETFATSADIYRLTGDLPEAADQQGAADGQGKSAAETEIRLARMIGRDRQDGTTDDWRRLATYFAERQLGQLHEAAAQVLSQGSLPVGAPLVGCGAGRFVARRLADRLQRPYRDLADLIPLEGASAEWASSCAPAVAVALLASAQAAAFSNLVFNAPSPTR